MTRRSRLKSRHLARAFQHFQKRVQERVEPLHHVCARWLFDNIIADINSGEPAVMRFRGRTLNKDRRLWMMDIGGTEFGVIFDHDLGAPVTILSDFHVERNFYSKCVLIKPDVRPTK